MSKTDATPGKENQQVPWKKNLVEDWGCGNAQDSSLDWKGLGRTGRRSGCGPLIADLQLQNPAKECTANGRHNL